MFHGKAQDQNGAQSSRYAHICLGAISMLDAGVSGFPTKQSSHFTAVGLLMVALWQPLPASCNLEPSASPDPNSVARHRI